MYGRKMMIGFIGEEFSLSVRQNRVENSLATVYPLNYQQRREGTFRQVNPIPYRTDYFRHKMHFDKNEKLMMYGVTHVVAIDSHSRFIMGVYAMPRKNNLVIYKEFFSGIFHELTNCVACPCVVEKT